MQLYQNPAILESSVCMKPLLWAQDYCSIPKWQAQNTVRVIRVIAKPTTWKTSTVLVPRTQPITIEKLGRKCSIKVQPQWKEYNLNLSSGGKLQFSFHLCFPFFFSHKCVSQCSTCAHAYSSVPLMFPPCSMLRPTFQRTHGHISYLWITSVCADMQGTLY